MKSNIIYNKKINYNYNIIKKFKAGIILKGWEVKSILFKNIDIKNSYIKINQKKEIFLKNANIIPLKNHLINKKHLQRNIKILLKKKQINYLHKYSLIKGNTIMLLSIYILKSWYKIYIALCQGKKKYDKREQTKYKTWKKYNKNIDFKLI